MDRSIVCGVDGSPDSYRALGVATEFARRLGAKLIVANVVAYVPEGPLDPPARHMRFAGTITLPEEYFAKLLEFTARSFKAHGFLDIVFIGDSGGNQPGQKTVADALNKEWAATTVRVHHAEAYYTANGSDESLICREAAAFDRARRGSPTARSGRRCR